MRRNEEELAAEAEARAVARARQALLGQQDRQRPVGTRLLHRLDAASATAGATGVAAAVSVGFLLGALVARHASEWLTVFEAIAAAVTLVMVFALQRTQSRQQSAVQRKLDEILRVLPGADTRLVHLESASEEELEALDERHSQLREAALEHPDNQRRDPA